MVTGESVPADKKAGDEVTGGTINRQGSFTFRALRVGSETVLARIIRMVEDAQGSKAPIQNIADRIAAVFVPAVLVLAALTFIVWLTVGTPILGFSVSLSYALMGMVGILVIACPCALSCNANSHHHRCRQGRRVRHSHPQCRKSREAQRRRYGGLRQNRHHHQRHSRSD